MNIGSYIAPAIFGTAAAAGLGAAVTLVGAADARASNKPASEHDIFGDTSNATALLQITGGGALLAAAHLFVPSQTSAGFRIGGFLAVTGLAAALGAGAVAARSLVD